MLTRRYSLAINVGHGTSAHVRDVWQRQRRIECTPKGCRHGGHQCRYRRAIGSILLKWFTHKAHPRLGACTHTRAPPHGSLSCSQRANCTVRLTHRNGHGDRGAVELRSTPQRWGVQRREEVPMAEDSSARSSSLAAASCCPARQSRRSIRRSRRRSLPQCRACTCRCHSAAAAAAVGANAHRRQSGAIGRRSHCQPETRRHSWTRRQTALAAGWRGSCGCLAGSRWTGTHGTRLHTASGMTLAAASAIHTTLRHTSHQNMAQFPGNPLVQQSHSTCMNSTWHMSDFADDCRD